MPKIKAEIQKVQIKNSSELKEILNLDFDIYIPEFEEIIELTQKELDELREKIILHKENKDLLKEIITEIIETKKITIFSLSWLMQDWLREWVEKEQRIENLQSSQDQEIESIDISKWIEVQKQNLKTLGMGLMFLLQELAIKWVKKEELSSLKNFKDLFLSYQDKISIQTKKVWEKFIEILSSDNKELKEFITLNWKKNIKKVYSQVQDIEDIYKNISEGKKIPDWNKIIKFFEKNKKNILLWAIILVWIYGLYKIWSLFFWKKEKKEWKKRNDFLHEKLGNFFDYLCLCFDYDN